MSLHPKGLISSRVELENTITLGLPLWALIRYPSGSKYIRPMKQPRFKRGPRGTKLICFDDAALDEYLARWNIEDHDNHHTVYSYGHTLRWIFNSPIEAEIFQRGMAKRRYPYEASSS